MKLENIRLKRFKTGYANEFILMDQFISMIMDRMY